MNEHMNLACEKALENLKTGNGGPFGAVIVDRNGNVISKENNHVLKNNDPTAHAEVMAIRKACENLGTYDLEGCTLYTSCEPCPMCLSAIIWANIKDVYYACDRHDADEIGFRDNMIYEYLKGENEDLIKITQLDKTEAKKVFDKYKEENRTIY